MTGARSFAELFNWPLRLLMILALPILAAGCVADPEAPVTPGPSTIGTRGVIVVNEGLWRQDNSTLTYYDPATGAAIQDYFALRNPGLRLGDTGNDIVIRNGRAYIAVTTSQTVEVMEIATGRSLGRLLLPPNTDPRRLWIASDSVGYVTGFKDDAVTEFNPTTLTIRRHVPVGPAPEGVVEAGGKVYVANSGYGTFRQSEPKASTISVLDSAGGGELGVIPGVTNPIQLHVMKGRLFALARPIRPDSIGALVEIDPGTLRVRHRWEMIFPILMAIDDTTGEGFVVAQEGLFRIDLNGTAAPEPMVPAASHPGATFYSVGLLPGSDAIYLGDARGYVAPGEILILDRRGALKGRFPCGLNPGSYGVY